MMLRRRHEVRIGRPGGPSMAPLGRVEVAAGDRHLEAGGQPFFPLVDTAWDLIWLDEADAHTYFATRQAQGFNAFAFTCGHLLEINRLNVHGDPPLTNVNDITSHHADYWSYIEWLVDTGAAYGLYACVLPCWGDTTTAGSSGDRFIETGDAEAHGEAVGAHLSDRDHVMWWLGGDVTGNARVALFRNLAQGLENVGADQIKSYHPPHSNTSRSYFNHATDDAWLAYSIAQTGHGGTGVTPEDQSTWELVGVDYDRTPTKPCFEGEPPYEEFGGFGGGYVGGVKVEPFNVRQHFWWAVLAGGKGHTYGAWQVWQFWREGKDPILSSTGTPWQTAVNFDGAAHCGAGRAVLERTPWWDLEPDQPRITAGQQTDGARIACATSPTHALVYAPYGHAFTLDTSGLPSEGVWVDPATGDVEGSASGPEFDPPGDAEQGNDWLLVLGGLD